MWNRIGIYAKPETVYQICNKIIPKLGLAAVLILFLGCIWGLAFAPADRYQGDGFRIIYVHVPAAWISLSAYAAMAGAAFFALAWQYKVCSWLVAAIAPIGAVFTFIALVTGAIWGKPMWGVWWIWDARLTSELILLFLYLAVILLYNAFPDKNVGSKAAAIFSLVGVVNIPIIKYSVDWWTSLHQPASIKLAGKSAIASSMLYPLLINILGFYLLFALLVLLRLRVEIVSRNISKRWLLKTLT